jgi:hypothetical protein
LFDHKDIRVGMDVFTRDNVYLGAVIALHTTSARGGAADPRADAEDSAQDAPRTHGEMLGPMPTALLGNPGPRTQGAREAFGVRPDAPPLGRGHIVVGKWWGLQDRRSIPLEDVQTVSLERVVLRPSRGS